MESDVKPEQWQFRGCGSLSVGLGFNHAVLIWCKKTQPALCSRGLTGSLWFFFSSVTENKDSGGFESKPRGGRAMKHFLWAFFFLFFSFFFYYFMCRYSPHCCMHTCYVMLLYPLLKVRAVSCHFWLEGPPFINLAVERARAHVQGGRTKHIVIFSHCTKVASLISARTSGQKSTQLKSGQICERAT